MTALGGGLRIPNHVSPKGVLREPWGPEPSVWVTCVWDLLTTLTGPCGALRIRLRTGQGLGPCLESCIRWEMINKTSH